MAAGVGVLAHRARTQRLISQSMVTPYALAALRFQRGRRGVMHVEVHVTVIGLIGLRPDRSHKVAPGAPAKGCDSPIREQGDRGVARVHPFPRLAELTR